VYPLKSRHFSLPYPSLLILLFSISKLRALHFSCNVVFEYLNSIGKIFLMVVSIFFVSNVEAQVNLVSNPSFEIMATCPNSLSQIMFASGWDTLRNGGGSTSDYYNECCLFSACRVPDNLKGFQIPCNGKSYAGVISVTQFASGLQVREYIQGALLNALNYGNHYCVKFYVSLSNRSKFSCIPLGAYLDNGQITSAPGTAPLPIVHPQVLNVSAQLDDTLNWFAIEGSFTANGTEEYITIGNFFPDSLSTIQPFQFGTGTFLFEGAYYYIDDVSVIDISTPAFAGNDTSITAGDSIYLGRPSEIGLDEACVWFLNGIPIDTVAGIMVAPDSSTTYILQQTICGNVQYDSVTVTVYKGTGISTLNKKDRFEVYPNPSNGEMYISFSLQNNEKAKILIQDVVGREIVAYQLTEDQNKLLIQENNFKNGVYFISLIVDGKLELTKKAIILK
jgi:hypothetical protein